VIVCESIAGIVYHLRFFEEKRYPSGGLPASKILCQINAERHIETNVNWDLSFGPPLSPDEAVRENVIAVKERQRRYCSACIEAWRAMK
jgi:hypothetical protein